MSFTVPRAAMYARFSSDNQRTESIDAQIRAMKKYCQEQKWQVVATYVDEARSATTDRRPSFLKMIEDSGKGLFDIVLVHKLDRFSRNRYDSAIYKSRLKKNNVSIASVLERIDDSPESVMMESVLEGMAEYYSANLRREVFKGLTETALQCKHTGGCCPLGYDLDSERRLTINEHEAEAVRIIFDMFDRGCGYTAIINHLNENGYHPKRGGVFGKNSLCNILSNEKYKGVYVFNKTAGKDSNGRRNSNRHKEYNEIIRIEGGCPAIVSKELFDRVQRRKAANKRNNGRYHAKEFYLLTGNVFCGVCGKRMQGNLRFSGNTKARLCTYRCKTRRKDCKNKEVNKDYLDAYIVELLRQRIFNPKSLRKIVNTLNKHIRQYNQDYDQHYSEVEKQLSEIESSLANLTAAIEKGIITESVIERAEQLEAERAELSTRLQELHQFDELQYAELSSLIDKLKQLERNTEEFRDFVQTYIVKVTVFPFHLEIELNTGLSIFAELNQTVTIRRGELYEMFESRVKE